MYFVYRQHQHYETWNFIITSILRFQSRLYCHYWSLPTSQQLLEISPQGFREPRHPKYRTENDDPDGIRTGCNLRASRECYQPTTLHLVIAPFMVTLVNLKTSSTLYLAFLQKFRYIYLPQKTTGGFLYHCIALQDGPNGKWFSPDSGRRISNQLQIHSAI